MSDIHGCLLSARRNPQLMLGFWLYAQPAKPQVHLIHAVLDQVLEELQNMAEPHRMLTAQSAPNQPEQLVPDLAQCLAKLNALHPWFHHEAGMPQRQSFETVVQLLTQVLIAITNKTADGWLVLQEISWLHNFDD